MGIDTLKQEDLTEINENELDFFCDSLTSAKKCQYTLGNLIDIYYLILCSFKTCSIELLLCNHNLYFRLF